jgi:ATP/ADP translocase
MSAFLGFFGAFATIIYPNTHILHPTAACDVIQAALPVFFAPVVAIFRNWTYALFYTLANLWGSVVVSLLFWGFANEITTVDEAKKVMEINNIPLIIITNIIISLVLSFIWSHGKRCSYLLGPIC